MRLESVLENEIADAMESATALQSEAYALEQRLSADAGVITERFIEHNAGGSARA